MVGCMLWIARRTPLIGHHRLPPSVASAREGQDGESARRYRYLLTLTALGPYFGLAEAGAAAARTALWLGRPLNCPLDLAAEIASPTRSTNRGEVGRLFRGNGLYRLDSLRSGAKSMAP